MNKSRWDELKRHLLSSKWIPCLMLQTLHAGVCILLSILRADIGAHTKLIWTHRILDKNMFLFEKYAGTVTTYSSQQHYSNPDITNSWEADFWSHWNFDTTNNDLRVFVRNHCLDWKIHTQSLQLHWKH